MPVRSRRCPSSVRLAALAWVVTAGAAAHGGDLPYPVSTATLDNGLRVYVVEMDSAKGAAAVATWMSVGSRDEVQEGRTGFAHFFEHLMFHGTEEVPEDERERRLLRLGIADNAWTWLDETVYLALAPEPSLQGWFTLEADRLMRLSLTEAGVDKEAGAVYGEFRKQRADPHAVLSERLYATAFQIHPYHHDTIGIEADIEAMPGARADAVAFFARHYRPENAAVLVVGDVAPDEVHAMVADALGGWEKGTDPRPEIPAEPPQTESRRAQIAWPSPTSPLLAMGWRIGAHDPNDPKSAHLELAARLLLADTGPLKRRLVRTDRIAYRVGGGRDRTVDPGLFRIEVDVRSDDDLPEAEAIVREEIASLAASVPADRLEGLKRHLRNRFRSSLDDPMTVLHVLGASLRRDPDPEALDRHRDALAAATADDVAAAVREALVDEVLTVVTLTGPEEEAP